MNELIAITSGISNVLSIIVSLVAIWHIRKFLLHTAETAVEDTRDNLVDLVNTVKK